MKSPLPLRSIAPAVRLAAALALAALGALLPAVARAGDSPAPAAPPAAGKPAAPAPTPPAAGPEAPKMDSLQLVLLRRGPAWTAADTPEVREIQRGHIAHLTRMNESGKLVVAGPFDKQPDPTLRGLCLYRVATPEEARALAEEDPAVKAGRLKVEVMTWWFQKGAIAFPLVPAAK